MENAYGSFAGVYEELMDNVPYDAWCSRILELFREAGLSEGLVAELGCGTGSMTRRLADAGYDRIRLARISCIFCRTCGALSFTERWGQWYAAVTVSTIS